jgi:hypothetical protein
MPRYVCSALLASALLVPPPAAADPICSYIGTTGTLLGEQVLANPCVGYGGEVGCTVATPGVALVGLVLVICRPV